MTLSLVADMWKEYARRMKSGKHTEEILCDCIIVFWDEGSVALTSESFFNLNNTVQAFMNKDLEMKNSRFV